MLSEKTTTSSPDISTYMGTFLRPNLPTYRRANCTAILAPTFSTYFTTHEIAYKSTLFSTIKCANFTTIDAGNCKANLTTHQTTFVFADGSSFTPTTEPSVIPTCQYSVRPSMQPVIMPSRRRPSSIPSHQPGSIPSKQPSYQAKKQLSNQPSYRPFLKPSSQPIHQPTGQPTLQPKKCPSRQPSLQPVPLPKASPSQQPNIYPTNHPSRQPSQSPYEKPSARPIVHPSSQPSSVPSTQPLKIPLSLPSSQPLLSCPSNQPSVQPFVLPSSQPFYRPSMRPSNQPLLSPTVRPTYMPTKQPNKIPTFQPTNQPSRAPRIKPSRVPTNQPTRQPYHGPTNMPSRRPKSKPSSQPFKKPTAQPLVRPSRRPSSRPTRIPSFQPTTQPKRKPSAQPSRQPIINPTHQPLKTPTRQPTWQPSQFPSSQPSLLPRSTPTKQPQGVPSTSPSRRPRNKPTKQPTRSPTKQPDLKPIRFPSTQPTLDPSMQPSKQPFIFPTNTPSAFPSKQPSKRPSKQPTVQPISRPSRRPSRQPLRLPSRQPISKPSRKPSNFPSSQPSAQPKTRPTLQGTMLPSAQPKLKPSMQPAVFPTERPTFRPSKQPTHQPTGRPNRRPSLQPIKFPSKQPFGNPTWRPTMQPTSQPLHKPSRQPFKRPSLQPSAIPTYQPSRRPFVNPSTQPSSSPSEQPFLYPTKQPSKLPSSQPARKPTKQPSFQPLRKPSRQPSKQPLVLPTRNPSAQPLRHPSFHPSSQESSYPSNTPTFQPTDSPSNEPTQEPSKLPSSSPSNRPSQVPYRSPSSFPTSQPFGDPSRCPTIQPIRNPSMQPIVPPSAFPSVHPSILSTKQPAGTPTAGPSIQTIVEPTSTPTVYPTIQPFSSPLVSPSQQPTLMPFRLPTFQPRLKPSSFPTVPPTQAPSILPVTTPSRQPFACPTKQPSLRPTVRPLNRLPTQQPQMFPTAFPISAPSLKPRIFPSSSPTKHPTDIPSQIPFRAPSKQPSKEPSNMPVSSPSSEPSKQPYQITPTSRPIVTPTFQPTLSPSEKPLCEPSIVPSNIPTGRPSLQPTFLPTKQPSHQPFRHPSCQPLRLPSRQPSKQPFRLPSRQPSRQPSRCPSAQLTRSPTFQPLRTPTDRPSECPSSQPTYQPILIPKSFPSRQPTGRPSKQPIRRPVRMPSSQPSKQPVRSPSKTPSLQPHKSPTKQPIKYPTSLPSFQPINPPTLQPTLSPSTTPTRQPSHIPLRKPSNMPSHQPKRSPTYRPRNLPSLQPLNRPSIKPNKYPSKQPLCSPSNHPSTQPSANPSRPSSQPSKTPTCKPTRQPSKQPYKSPSRKPSKQPSIQPRQVPTAQPSTDPTSQQSFYPSYQPSDFPTSQPSLNPSTSPSRQPSSQPKWHPTHQPFTLPSRRPSRQPKGVPSARPTVNPTSSAPSIKPTGAPSSRPISSIPTLFGETPKPTNTPSSRPTYNLKTHLTDTTYQYYTNSKSQFASTNYTFGFSSFYYKGTSISGNCDTWRYFYESTVNLPDSSFRFVSISASFQNTDLRTRRRETLNTTCRDITVVEKIVSSLQYGVNYQATCDDQTWKVFRCLSNTLLCINCKYSCKLRLSLSSNSFLLSPCNSASTYISAAALLKITYAPSVLYPLFSSKLDVSASANSIVIMSTLTAPGYVTCAAFSHGFSVTDLFQISSVGSTQLSDIAGAVKSVVIPDLYSAAIYDVYCYTADFSGHFMPLDVSESYVISSVSTNCCKRLLFSTFFDFIYAYNVLTAIEPIFTFSLNSIPTSEIVLQLLVVKANCTSKAILTNLTTPSYAIPAAFKFNSKSQTLNGNFKVRGPPGCYLVVAYSTGADRFMNVSKFVKIYDSSTRVAVPSPILTNVTFSNDGTRLIVQFDAPTDRAQESIPSYSSVFSCSQLMVFPGSVNSTCIWQSSDTLEAVLSNNIANGSVVMRGDIVKVLPNKIKRLCLLYSCLYAFNSAMQANVMLPAKPIMPLVSISFASAVSPCDGITLDPTLSSGNGGRRWSLVEWAVSGSESESAISAISSYLNNLALDTSAAVFIPHYYFQLETTYYFQLKLQNFLEQSGVGSVSVQVSSFTNIPYARIFGAPYLTFYRWQSIRLISSFTSSACVNSSSFSPSLSWKVFKGTMQVASVQSSFSALKIRPFILDSNANYSVQLRVADSQFPEMTSFTSSYITLLILKSDLIATIKGGSAQTRRLGAPAVIDASSSYDKDYPGALLTFTWNCAYLSPSFGLSCSLDTRKNSSVVIASPASPSVVVITVYVHNSYGQVSSTSVTISYVNQKYPIISLINPNPLLSGNSKVIISGTVFSQNTTITTWSSPNFADLSSANVALTPVSILTSNGSNSVFVSIRANSLTPGVTYTFSLTASVHYASVTFRIAFPPYGGYLHVKPSEGVALNTSFSLVTSLWSGDSSTFPFVYAFSYYAVGSSTQFYIRSSDVRPYTSAFLGPGFYGAGYSIQCVATVTDYLGGTGNASSFVTVVPPGADSLAVVLDSAASIFYSAAVMGDPVLTIQSVHAYSLLLNSVDCSMSPSCAAMNRLPCARVANTCGQCLPGFIGVDSDSNIPCKEQSLIFPDGAQCVDNSSCISADCRANQCMSAKKACPNNCYGKGTCAFFDSNNFPVSSCTVQDVSCHAQCLCVDGRYGADCSLQAQQFASYAALRETMCTSLLDTAKYNENGTETVMSTMVSVSNIFADPSQISLNSLGNCSELLFSTIKNSTSIVCSAPRILTLVYAAIAATQAAAISINAPLKMIQSIGNVPEQLGVGCLPWLTVGEPASTIYVDGIKSVSAVFTKVAALSSYVLALPVTAFQAFEGIVGDSFSIKGAAMTASGVYGATVSYDSMFSGSVIISNSSLVGVQLVKMREEESSSSNSRRLSNEGEATSFQIDLSNKHAIDYTVYPSTYRRIECLSYTAVPYALFDECPHGIAYSVLCPANQKGFFNITCPSVQHVPVCEAFDSGNQLDTTRCLVRNFSSTTTSCLCKFNFGRTNSQLTSLGITQSVFVKISSTYKTMKSPLLESFFPFKSSKHAISYTAVATLSFLGVILLTSLCLRYFYYKVDYQKKLSPGKGEQVGGPTISAFFGRLFKDDFNKAKKGRLYAQKLFSEHHWLKFNVISTSSLAWIRFDAIVVLVGRLLAIVLATTLMSRALFYDNGHCEDVHSESSCKSSHTILKLRHDCQWNYANQFCSYSPIPLTADLIILCVSIILFAAAPVNAVLDQVANVAFPIEASQPLSMEAAEKRNLQYKNHEFESAQSLKKKILLGARLSKMVVEIDSVSCTLEAQQVADKIQLRVDTETDFPIPAAISRCNLDATEGTPFKSLVEAVNSSRVQAVRLTKILCGLESDMDKDAVLFKYFLLFNLPCILQPLGQHALFYEDSAHAAAAISLWKKSHRQLLSYSARLFMAMYFIGAAYYLVLFGGLTLATIEQYAFVAVLWTAIAADALMVQSLKVYLKWIVLVNWLIGKHIRAFERTLYKKTKLILMRSFGVLRSLRSFGVLVHHLNPACRAARELPHLHVSRLLLALGDDDVAIYRNKPLRGISCLLGSQLGHFPFWISEALGEMLLVALLCGLHYAIYRLYFFSMIAVVLVSIGLLSIISLAFFKKRVRKSAVDIIHILRFVSGGSIAVDSSLSSPAFHDLSADKEEHEVPGEADNADRTDTSTSTFLSRRKKYQKTRNVRRPNPLAPVDEQHDEPIAHKGVSEKLSSAAETKESDAPAMQPFAPHTNTPATTNEINRNDDSILPYPPPSSISMPTIPMSLTSSRQFRRSGRKEQTGLHGPGGITLDAFQEDSSSTRINSSTYLSELVLVNSDVDLPVIDILFQAAPESPPTVAGFVVRHPARHRARAVAHSKKRGKHKPSHAN